MDIIIIIIIIGRVNGKFGFINEHITLVKSFQKRKENGSLKSVFKDSKRYIEEIQLDCQFNDGAALIGQANQVVTVHGKGPKNIKAILVEVLSRREELQSWNSPGLDNM